MIARPLVAVLVLAGSIALPSALAGGGPHRPPSPVPAAEPAPSPLPPAGPRVRWVFREQDLVTCRTPAALLRHLRARFGGEELAIAAFAVGMSQSRAESFFRAERLEFPVEGIEEAALQALSPDTPPPGLYFMLGDSVVASFRVADIGRYPEPSEVEPVLPRLLPHAGPAEN
ncbi:MAG TPA: hypothetical protein VF006_02045 [Longimicrobium sp.]